MPDASTTTSRRWRRCLRRRLRAWPCLRKSRHRLTTARTDQAARLPNQWLRFLRAVSYPHRREPRHLGRQLNLVVVWREAPLFSSRERAALAWTEALTLVT